MFKCLDGFCSPKRLKTPLEVATTRFFLAQLLKNLLMDVYFTKCWQCPKRHTKHDTMTHDTMTKQPLPFYAPPGLLLALLLLSSFCAAQVRVSGRVTDKADASGLIGATVREKGGDNGAVADLEGHYSFEVKSADAVLVFSYVGYEVVEVPLAGRSEVNVSLGESAAVLDLVVVVGYGTQKKSDLTGAVGSVKTKDLERVATGSIDQALQGKIAGVYVTPASGDPGAGAIIRIRGTGTLNNANPIYVIDGMITYDASFVNPQDVASVEVLKDASACAIYGSRGANGVILITTKSGRQRKAAVLSLSSYYGVQAPTKTIPLMNAAQFAQAYNELTNTPYYANPAALGAGTDWQEEIFRQAPIANVQLGVNGGGERYFYNLSGNYFKQSGILQKSEFQRVTVRFNNEFKVNDWFTIGNNLAFSNRQSENPTGSVLSSAYRMPPVFAARDSTGDFTDPTTPFGLAIANPAADLFYKSNNRNKSNRFFGTVFGEVQFLKHFKFKSNFGFDLTYGEGKTFMPKFEVSPSQLNKEDRLGISYNVNRDWLWEQTLTYDHSWDRHALTVLAGYTAESRRFQFFGAGRSSFPGVSDDILYLNVGNDTTQTNYGGAGERTMVSYLFRTNYSFLRRYLITASLRIDQSSQFAAALRRGVFPSASIGWNLAEESFFKRLNLFDRLKVRCSYGILGNQESNSTYPSFGQVVTGLYSVFGSGENLNQGATLISLGNPNLRWETARQTDVGLEFGFLNGRLTGEVDWYQRFTYDIIAAVPIPAYIGSQNPPTVNTGKVRNTGWDITLNWRQGGRFAWNLGAILAPVKNELVALNAQKPEQLSAFLQGEPATRSASGLPLGAFYGYQSDGVFQTAEEALAAPRLGNETAGDLRYKDLNNDGKITGDDRTYLGSPIPTLTYGFSAGFDFAGFDFAADLLGVRGNKVYNAKKTFRFSVYNWEQSVFDGRWTPENPTADKPRITNGGHNYRVSDYYLEDGAFVRLRSVVLGYSLPSQWLKNAKIAKCRFYASGTNLWTRQKYSGYSPEFPNGATPYEVGIDFLNYPVTKSWQAGIEVTF